MFRKIARVSFALYVFACVVMCFFSIAGIDCVMNRQPMPAYIPTVALFSLPVAVVSFVAWAVLEKFS